MQEGWEKDQSGIRHLLPQPGYVQSRMINKITWGIGMGGVVSIRYNVNARSALFPFILVVVIVLQRKLWGWRITDLVVEIAQEIENIFAIGRDAYWHNSLLYILHNQYHFFVCGPMWILWVQQFFCHVLCASCRAVKPTLPQWFND